MENSIMRDKTLRHLEGIFKTIGEIEARNPKTPKQYTDMGNETYYECPIGYNGGMSHAMASDMFYFHTALSAAHPGLSDETEGWAIQMDSLNRRLLRMMDDDTDGQPMEPWGFKEALGFAGQVRSTMGTAAGYNEAKPDSLLDDFLARCETWASRIIRMCTWAYYLENMENITQTMATIQAGTPSGAYGKAPGPDREKLIAVTCQARKLLTGLLIETPVDTTDYKYVIGKLNLFDNICREVQKQP